LQEISYTTDQSCEEENKLGRKFLQMREKAKNKRIRYLWYSLMAKAKGAVLIIDNFS
jgi:hypothetical protein